MYTFLYLRENSVQWQAFVLSSAMAAAENCHLKGQTLKVKVSSIYSCIFQVVSSLWVFQLEICMHFSPL
jgi:hypothetical protein